MTAKHVNLDESAIKFVEHNQIQEVPGGTLRRISRNARRIGARRPRWFEESCGDYVFHWCNPAHRAAIVSGEVSQLYLFAFSNDHFSFEIEDTRFQIYLGGDKSTKKFQHRDCAFQLEIKFDFILKINVLRVNNPTTTREFYV